MSVKILKVQDDEDLFKFYFKDFKYTGIEREYVGMDLKQRILKYIQQGEAYYAIADSKMIGIGGIIPLWQGSGFAYVFFNQEVRLYFKSIYCKIKEVLNEYFKNGYDRIQTYCLANKLEAQRFLEAFGFKREGLMKRFFRQTDYYMYAIVKEN